MTTNPPNEIQLQMARIRRELDVDVNEVVEQANELVDWRNFVKRHPLVTVGAATAIGFMLVPSRYNVISPDADTLAELAKQNKLVVKSQPEVRKQAGIMAPMVSFIGAAIIRSALAMAGQQMGKILAPASSGDAVNAQADQTN